MFLFWANGSNGNTKNTDQMEIERRFSAYLLKATHTKPQNVKTIFKLNNYISLLSKLKLINTFMKPKTVFSVQARVTFSVGKIIEEKWGLSCHDGSKGSRERFLLP